MSAEPESLGIGTYSLPDPKTGDILGRITGPTGRYRTNVPLRWTHRHSLSRLDRRSGAGLWPLHDYHLRFTSAEGFLVADQND